MAGLLIGISIHAQRTIANYHPNKKYIDAKELFEKEKYAAALNLFQEFILENHEPGSELSINAEFYSNICSLYLFHKDAEFNLEQFVADHPESAWVERTYLELANYNYKRKRYSKALDWYAYVDPKELSKSEKIEFYYKRGHSYFMDEEYDKAKYDFKQMLGEESEYQTPATYYFSHIAYEEGNTETALMGFEQLKDDPNFAPLIPYYIAQIYYSQERYNELLSYAKPLVDSASTKETKRLPEISRLVGDAYYRTGGYDESVEYLEYYLQNTDKSDLVAEDYYQLGYAYYTSNQYNNALDLFAECSDEDSEIGQSASYFMGDCYLKLEEKEYARAAFKTASESDYNLKIKEDALFNYAKLAFELSYNPFHEAITAFEQYLENYPDSDRGDEAYEFLLNVYMKSKNYEAAINSLDKIENKDARTQEAYQLVSFNRGVELFKTQKYEEAEEYFNKVSTYQVNYTLLAEALFWKGEIAYRKENFNKAFDLYNQFTSEAGSVNSGFYNEANYCAAYTLFKQKKYDQSTTWFRKYVDASNADDDQRKVNDAYLRLGDCYYVNKDFNKAIKYYDEAIATGEGKRDYALFQKGICYGLKGDKSKKIEVLQQLINSQSGSKYSTDAKYSLAKSYLEDNQLNKSRDLYQDIIDNHKNTPYVKYAMRDLLLIALKKGDDQEVINIWNELIALYPNDPIRNDAYQIAEEVLIANNVDIPDNIVDQDELEARVFELAENAALSGDCEDGIEKLENYLTKYDPGIYATAANYYLANCYFDQGDLDKALNSYNYVINQPVNVYTEECLVVAATINYNNKNYTQAKNHYTELEQVAKVENNILEAQIGLLRCHFWLNEYSYALEYADKVIVNPATPADILKTAYLWRGKIRMEYDNIDDAYYDFAEVIKLTSNAEAAEAKYNMALIAYIKEAYKPAEKEIFELIEDYSSYGKWKYSGFLLLVDVYIGMDDLFQAKATVNTILDNVSEPWVIDEARDKKEYIEQLESGTSPSPGEDEIEIDLSGDDEGEDEDLFND